MAATMTSCPCARAASSTSSGKLPLPAMRPSLERIVRRQSFSRQKLYKGRSALLDHAALGGFYEADQLLHVVAEFTFGAQLGDGLRSIELGIQQQAIGVMDLLQPLRGESAPLQAESIHAVGFGLARRGCLGKGQDVAGDSAPAADVRMRADADKLMHRAKRA